ncbi:MAG: rod shape-determining protein MreD [Candidatus Amulumruptor caecigallinarius]|nr:rod shape-determining protein MreD [Candidatus Amulumruptor caecigallinarius]
MSKEITGNLFILMVLLAVQVLVCNHIMLFNVAMAFVFIYVIIRLPMSLSTGWLLTWAFFAGLTVDIFSDTPGVNSLSCTLLAMLKRPAFYAYVPRDDRTKEVSPSLSSLGFAIYGKYMFTMSALYCTLAFTIEYFNFADVKEIVIMSALSAALTFLVLLGIDSLIVTNREKRL